MNEPLPLSFYRRVFAASMFVMQELAPSVNRQIMKIPAALQSAMVFRGAGCLSDYGSLRLRRRPQCNAAPLSHGKLKRQLWLEFDHARRSRCVRTLKSPEVPGYTNLES